MEDLQRRSGRSKRRHLTLEMMERRQLPSSAVIAAEESPSLGLPSVTAAALAHASGVSSQALDTSGSNSPLIGNNPTPHELARERFHAYFSGPVISGPGRFAGQAKILYLRGLGGCNMFVHGDYQMAIVFPTDPTTPLFGEAYLQDKNTNSGGAVAFQLQGTTPQMFDKHGRPTSFSFTDDQSISSGAFYSDTASGTIKIRYSHGTATAIFSGLVYTTGLTNPLKNSDL